MNDQIARDRQMIVDAKKRGKTATLGTFVKLSGPGWLQSAITLGGGSLAGSLYLGVLAGYSILWLQPLAMTMGVIMLSAISYVTLATGQRPFKAINTYVNPVLGWGWAIASLLANLVWLMPQFALGTAAVQQNLLPGVLGPESGMNDTLSKGIIVAFLFGTATCIVWFYHSGVRGIKIFESLLKIMVGIVVVSFFGVVATLASTLPWGEIFNGFIPNINMLVSPSDRLQPFIEAIGSGQREFWSNLVVSNQRDVMITAAATAVGINMTFLLPYSILARGWDREFRGLAIFDLSTGLFIPFMLVTTCVVVASASQFHAQPSPGLLGETDGNGQIVVPAPNIQRSYDQLVTQRLTFEHGAETLAQMSDEQKQSLAASLPEAEKRMAAMLVTRDAFNLAAALEPLTGTTVAQIVFGIGVLGMALSTIIMLMLINGFVVCEMFDMPAKGSLHRAGALMAATVGATGPFFWSAAAFWLAVPTSLFGMVLLPVAYITFALLMNQRKLLGKYMPTGYRRVQWNVLMTIALVLATFGALWSTWSKQGWYGLGAFAAFILLAAIVHFVFPRKAMPLADREEAASHTAP